LSLPRPPNPPPFPYTTLFRSRAPGPGSGSIEPSPLPAWQRPSSLHERVQLRRRHGVVEVAEGPLLPHLAGGGEQPGDRHAIERRSEEHTSELQSRSDLVCRLL